MDGKEILTWEKKTREPLFNEYEEKHIPIGEFEALSYTDLGKISQGFPDFVHHAYMDVFGIDLTDFEAPPAKNKISHHLRKMQHHVNLDGVRYLPQERVPPENRKRGTDAI